MNFPLNKRCLLLFAGFILLLLAIVFYETPKQEDEEEDEKGQLNAIKWRAFNAHLTNSASY